MRALVAPREIVADVAFARRRERSAARREPRAEQAQVAAIRFERVLREAVLQPQVIDELVEHGGVEGRRFGGGRHGNRAGGGRAAAPAALARFYRRGAPGSDAPSCASSQRLISRWKPSSLLAKPPSPDDDTTR